MVQAAAQPVSFEGMEGDLNPSLYREEGRARLVTRRRSQTSWVELIPAEAQGYRGVNEPCHLCP